MEHDPPLPSFAFFFSFRIIKPGVSQHHHLTTTPLSMNPIPLSSDSAATHLVTFQQLADRTDSLGRFKGTKVYLRHRLNPQPSIIECRWTNEMHSQCIVQSLGVVECGYMCGGIMQLQQQSSHRPSVAAHESY